MKHRIIGIALLAVMSTACSSIISDTDYPVAINSQPDGAQFSISNRDGQQVHSGITPSTVTLKSSAGYFRGETYTVTLRLDGYSDQIYSISSRIDGWYWGNILLGGLVGMLIVDPATGAMYNLPNRVDISLNPETASATERSLTIATIDSLTLKQREQLLPIDL